MRKERELLGPTEQKLGILYYKSCWDSVFVEEGKSNVLSQFNMVSFPPKSY